MPSDQQVDNLEEAKQLVGWLGEPVNPAHQRDPRDLLCAATAQAHASIAIAEELRGIREALDAGNLRQKWSCTPCPRSEPRAGPEDRGDSMRLRDKLTPFRFAIRGPYWRSDLRARARRFAEGWMPCALHHHFRRFQLARATGEPLSEVPRVGLPLHPIWIAEADIRWGEKVAREIELRKEQQ